MKYSVENDLSLFEFHDAVFSFVSYDGRDLVVSASHVNIHKDAPQNPEDYDMEIASARITFRNFHSATYEPGRVWKTGEDGKSYPVGPRVVYSDQEGIDRIIEELRNEITVYHLEKEENGSYSIGGCGMEPYFTIEFQFDSVIICWDEYRRKAWYELHRTYRYDVTLHTPNGDETVKLTVGWHEESEPAVNVGCRFDDREYWGHGSDEYWIDAFADLQRQLPEGVVLKCCLTCRHGNLCPFGNEFNELFCTKDLAITQKSDLYVCTQDRSERAKRSRQYCAFCEDYQPQSGEHFTYNDFWDYFQKG